MSEEKKGVYSHDVPTCPRCRAVQMVEIMSIAPAEAEELREMEREYQKNPDLFLRRAYSVKFTLLVDGAE